MKPDEYFTDVTLAHGDTNGDYAGGGDGVGGHGG